MLGELIITIITLLYILYRLRPDRLAEEIKYMTFAGVDDSVLARYIHQPKIIDDIDFIDLEWMGWSNYYDSKMDIVMRVLGGYGGLFGVVIKLRKFYFRELVMYRNAKMARSWIRDALRIGIIRKETDPNGVTQYVLDNDGIRRLIEYLGQAFDELLLG